MEFPEFLNKLLSSNKTVTRYSYSLPSVLSKFNSGHKKLILIKCYIKFHFYINVSNKYQSSFKIKQRL